MIAVGVARRRCKAAVVIISTRSNSSLSQIPGPTCYPFIGSSWKYMTGDYDVSRLDEVGRKKLEEFGEVVVEHLPGVKAVNVFNPADIRAVFQAEGRYPRRRSHLALQQYRADRPFLYNSPGLFPSNGEEWWRLRQTFQQCISPLQETRQFLPAADRITKSFIRQNIGSSKLILDFLPLVSRLNLNLTWAALFGEKAVESVTESDADMLVQAAEACNESVLATDSTQFIWKHFRTPTYRHFERNMLFIESLAVRCIEEFKQYFETDGSESCIMASFLKSPNVDDKDILGMVVDLLLGGVDTTSYTSCMALYRLCMNVPSQVCLHSEASDLLPNVNDPLTAAHLSRASYTRAVLKETFRINPISVGTSRFLDQPICLSAGYELPQGCLVMTQNMVACRREKNFRRALEFLPERWIQSCDNYQGRVNPYLVLPFGHGPRACIARRRAEQNLLVFLIRVARSYQVKWEGEGHLDIVTPLINKPDRKVSLRFTPW